MAMLLLVAGFALLIVGAEAMVRGASKFAAAVGIPPVIIGLTVVAFGTSSPELAVSIMSGFSGEADIAVGNVVGSNIFNVLLILGVSALIAPLVVAQRLVQIDVPLMIVASVMMGMLGLDGKIGRGDGLLLFAGVIGYTLFLLRQSRAEKAQIQEEYNKEFGVGAGKSGDGRLGNIGLVIGGIAMLVLGSRWLVDGAVAIAQYLGVSELIIGLTIVAVGTSLPEVATSVVASLRGERDIAVGNVVGSNLFNILAVLGLAGILVPAGIDVSESALKFDIPVMIAVAVACLPIFFTGHAIARWEGGLFLGYYVAYTVYLVLDATSYAGLPLFAAAMIWFVVPLTAVTLIVLTVRAVRGGNPGHFSNR